MPAAPGGALSLNSQALNTPPQFHLAINNVQDLNVMADLLKKSGFFGQDAQAAIAVRLMAGLEAGFTPFAAITGTYVVNGKPAFGANMLAQAIKKSGKYDYRVVKKTMDGCTIRIIDVASGDVIGEEEFTQQDAQTAGLWHGPTWKKYPKQMLFNRCITMAMRTHTPEVLGGHTAYTPEELIAAQPKFKQQQYGEIDEHGMVEEVKVFVPDSQTSAAIDVPNTDAEPKAERQAPPRPRKVAPPQPEAQTIDAAAIADAVQPISNDVLDQVINGLNALAAQQDGSAKKVIDAFKAQAGIPATVEVNSESFKTQQHGQILLELLKPESVAELKNA